MYFGHIPAGYLSFMAMRKFMKNRGEFTTSRIQLLILLGLTASVLPDIDMLYFYFVDHRQHLHHGYFTHIPFYWFCAGVFWFLSSLLVQRIKFGIYGAIVMMNITLHLMLDTINAGIKWFYPFSQRYVVFIDVPSSHQWTVMNFITHWSFVFEVILILSAVYFYFAPFSMHRNRVEMKNDSLQ